MRNLMLITFSLLLINTNSSAQTVDYSSGYFLQCIRLHPDSTFRDDITQYNCPSKISIDTSKITVEVHCERFYDTIFLIVQDIVSWKDEQGFVTAYGGYEAETGTIYDSTYNAFFLRSESGIPTALTLDYGFVNYDDKNIAMQRIIYFFEEPEKRRIVENID